MMIVDIYCRVSTDLQEDNTSLDEQEATSKQFCKENSLFIGMVHREIFTGHMYREREKLSLVRERYLSGKIQGVVVRTFDRLARKEVHFGILLEEMEHNSVKLYCVKEALEDSVIGRLTRMFLAFLAEWEWEKIYERTTTGRINAAKQGKIVGGRKLPYGWKWKLDDKGNKEIIVIDEEQATHIRWMAQQYAMGTSTIDITRQLTERDVPSPEGGAQWHTITVRRILSNRRLIGKGQNFGNQPSSAKHPLEPIELPDGTYPMIISEEMFVKIQDRLARNKDESTRKSAKPEEFLLRTGYLKCALCGRTMRTRIDHNRGKERLLYRCKGYDQYKHHICKGQELPAKEVDAWVWGKIQELAEHTELIRLAVDIATNSTAMAADARAIDASLENWRQKVKNYLEDLADSNLRGDSRASIRQALNTANQHVEQLETERVQVLTGMIDREREKAAYEKIIEWCKTVKETQEELTYQQKRDFLHLMGIVVIAQRAETGGKVTCQMEIELPQIKKLISQFICPAPSQ